MMHFMRQLEEKNVAHEIDILLWSDRMDLVAYSNNKGEVALHRLTWTRAWNLPPTKEGDLVKGLAWRPDGKVLAVGYKSGLVLLISVENKAILHSFEVEAEISCVHWAQECTEPPKTNNKNITYPEESTDYMKFLDNSSIFLPDLDISTTFSTTNAHEIEISNFFKNQKDLNLLLVGTNQGSVYISIFGCFTPIRVNVNNLIGEKCSLLNMHLSENLNKILATVTGEEDMVKMVLINSEIFKTHRKELFATAMKYESLISLINKLSGTIANVKEHWESIFLEMDSKLSKFASKVPEGTLSADFLDLLMFGISSEEMQEFLLHDLTKKGLEKFGQTIEMSYGNIQKLLLKNVNKVGQSIAYHLADLRGMARLEHRYEVIGLQEEKITKALASNGAFLVKGGEMQQIINHSVISYKAFFRWLYTAIMHLMEEAIPPEIQKMTQQDVACISEFLLNFDEIGLKSGPSTSEKNDCGFNMERLGQYLSDSPLTVPSKMENEWDKFLMQNECIKEHPSIIKHYKEMSLVQQFNSLRDLIEDIFAQPTELIANHIIMNDSMSFQNLTDKDFKVTCINASRDVIYLAFTSQAPPSDCIYFMEVQTSTNEVVVRGARLYFTQFVPPERESLGDAYWIMDVKFYSTSVLSFLFQENSAAKVGVICQFPLAFITDKLQRINMHYYLEKESFVSIDGTSLGHFGLTNTSGMKVSKFSVSGLRKVSVVLSDSKRKVRLYEMEVDDEEEEDNDITASTVRESDASAHENSDAE